MWQMEKKKKMVNSNASDLCECKMVSNYISFLSNDWSFCVQGQEAELLNCEFPSFYRQKNELCGRAKRNSCYTFQGILFRLNLLV